MTALDRSAPGVRIVRVPDPDAGQTAPVDLGDRLLGFVFEDHERQTDRVILTLDNHDLRFFEREDVAAGVLLDVSWGYPGRMSAPQRVVLTSVKGFEQLIVEGQSTDVLLNRETRTRSWDDVPLGELVREVARGAGFSSRLVEVEATDIVLPSINQVAETDARFLRRLAEREGFEFFVDPGGLHFHRRRTDAAPTHRFVWRAEAGAGSVLQVQVESEFTPRVGVVETVTRDPLTRSTVRGRATAESAERATLGDVIEVVDPETGETVRQQRLASRTERSVDTVSADAAQRAAEDGVRRAERETVRLKLTVVGDPSLAAKRVVEVDGISTWLSGKYYVVTCRHNLSGAGYVCELSLSRDAFSRRTAVGRESEQRPQGGTRNDARIQPPDAVRQIEVVDPETGRTRIEYRGGRGSADPEAQRRG